MEHVVDKRLKLDEPFMSDLQSAQPRPIKVTDPISNSTRADMKALENAKTGNAVVAVMHLYGNAKSSSINANAKVSAEKAKLESKSKELGLN